MERGNRVGGVGRKGAGQVDIRNEESWRKARMEGRKQGGKKVGREECSEGRKLGRKKAGSEESSGGRKLGGKKAG